MKLSCKEQLVQPLYFADFHLEHTAFPITRDNRHVPESDVSVTKHCSYHFFMTQAYFLGMQKTNPKLPDYSFMCLLISAHNTIK